MNERQELCPKCGRGYVLGGDYLPVHHSIKPNGTRTAIQCRGSGVHIEPHVVPIVEIKTIRTPKRHA